MVEGGVFVILKIVYEKTADDDNDLLWFTTKDICEATGLSFPAVSNNLNKLVKKGLLEQEFFHRDGLPGRCSRYRLKGDLIDVINNYIM